ncbi:protein STRICTOSIDINE SYNTHASE-LIKE 4-like [Canna indica]|uniref:Protein STRICTOSIDINE SYNTHASE-LIKE 4-like n=1 Tax=Canna indica TaxID=4628 RepID=A0AAQ3KNB6_9LILI|nr:protein STRICTOSIDINE SYNTHASE-LIKE 4-like [Canna indica]
MADDPNRSSPTPPQSKRSPWSLLGALLVLAPVAVSVVLYHTDDFHPAPIPADYFAAVAPVPERNDRILAISDRLGEGLLPGPEDLAYDEASGFLYTGCYDGWIRRVNLREEEAKVEDWAFVGGRPLGVVFAPGGDLVVAEADKGLMRVKPDGTMTMLTNEAEGVKFRLTDGVDVAIDGSIYFTDASYKYNFSEHMLDVLEGRPHGRLMSFDPSSNQTAVLARDLYFANGVSVAPDQRSVIFCETMLRRCRKYHIQGEKKGTVVDFIRDLPGLADNIRYDGQGHYWIGLSAGKTLEWDVLMKYPLLRKVLVIVEKFIKVPLAVRDSGVLKVDLEGRPLALYSDRGLALVTGGIQIGKHLYYGSLDKAYISRILI